jgi:hypothetical protein
LALVVELRSLTPTKDAELETMYGYCVGMTREDLRSREEARSALRRGCDLAPRSGEALYRMALFERKEGQLAAALRTLRERSTSTRTTSTPRASYGSSGCASRRAWTPCAPCPLRTASPP